MRTLLLLLTAIAMVSCIDSPSVTVTHPDGTTTTLRLGRNFMGKRQNVVAEATAPGGYGLRQMVQNEDATEVPKSGIRTIGTLGAASALAGTTQNAADNATAEVLGAQTLAGKKHATDAQLKAYEMGVGKAPAEAVTVGPALPPGSP